MSSDGTTLIWSTQAVSGGTGPKVAFIPVSGGTTGLIEITEIGFVDFTKVTN